MVGLEQLDEQIASRVGVLRRFWGYFDEFHAHQQPEMHSLWGLVEETQPKIDCYEYGPSVTGQLSDPELYKKLLPDDLLLDITELWGQVMSARNPERIITNLYPHHLMAITLGPALKFWHGCGLTTWFLTLGPKSRVQIGELERYYAAELSSLAEIGTPIDPQLFHDLTAAAPPPSARVLSFAVEVATEAVDETEDEVEEEYVTEEMGERADPDALHFHAPSVPTWQSDPASFERLRDIVTLYRRAWTAGFLDMYLHSLWQTKLAQAEAEYERLLVKKRTPSLSQFAHKVEEAANQWFGGDLAALCHALGKRSPVTPVRAKRLAVSPDLFVKQVFARLGGKPFAERDALLRNRDAPTYDWLKSLLAGLSLRYLQLEEELGRPPTLSEFHKSKFEGKSYFLSDNVEEAWEKYTRAVEDAKRDCGI